jgi:hypothetical protein
MDDGRRESLMEAPITWSHRPVYLDNPLLDRMMSVILDLATQLYVVQDRLALLESALEEKQVVSRRQLDDWQPTPEQQLELRRRRDEFVSSILHSLAED